MDRPPSRTNAYLALAVTMIVWGIAPAIVRNFSLTIGPWDSVFIRLVSVALMCLPMLPFSGIYIARKDWLRLLLVSCVGMFGYFIGSIYGLFYIKTGIGSIIIAIQPLIIAMLAAALGAERLTIATVSGLLISFLGALYMFGADVDGRDSNTMFGIAMLLLCNVAFAINVVFSKPLIQTYGALRTTLMTMIVTAVPALVFFRPSVIPVIANLEWVDWVSLFYLGFIGTIVVVVMWNYAVGQLRPATVGASLYVIPVLAAASGWFLLGETMSTQLVLAGLIILAGVAISEFGKDLSLTGKAAGFAAVIFAVCVWGMVPAATRYLVLAMPPQHVMIIRVIPAGVLGLLLAAYVGVRPMPGSAWVRLIIAALIGNVGYQVLSIFGTHYLPSSWTGMLFGLEPVFIAIFAVLFAGDRLTLWLIGGIAVAILGTACMALGSLVSTIKDVYTIGIILVTLGTMGWGIYTTMVRPVSAEFGAVPVACLTLGISALPMFALVTPDLPAALAGMSGFQIVVACFFVVFCTIGGTVAWNFALGHMDSATAGMFLYVQPIVAAVAGIVLLGEQVSIYLVAGGSLIILGVLISQFGPMVGRRSDKQKGQPARAAPSLGRRPRRFISNNIPQRSSVPSAQDTELR